MNKKQIKYISKEIKKANNLSVLIFNYLYRLNDKTLAKTIYRITEINEILSNLEAELEMKINAATTSIANAIKIPINTLLATFTNLQNLIRFFTLFTPKYFFANINYQRNQCKQQKCRH